MSFAVSAIVYARLWGSSFMLFRDLLATLRRVIKNPTLLTPGLRSLRHPVLRSCVAAELFSSLWIDPCSLSPV